MTRMWIALPAAAVYAAYLVVLRHQTRCNRQEARWSEIVAKATPRYTHVVVAVSPRVAAEIEREVAP